jgi:hypothetical protein
MISMNSREAEQNPQHPQTTEYPEMNKSRLLEVLRENVSFQFLSLRHPRREELETEFLRRSIQNKMVAIDHRPTMEVDQSIVQLEGPCLLSVGRMDSHFASGQVRPRVTGGGSFKTSQ